MKDLLQLFLLAAGLAGPLNPLLSQTIERESATGNYRLTYTDLDGRTHTVTIGAPDRVAPRLTLTVSPEGNALRYVYRLEHIASAEARSPITTVDVPCPAATAASAPPTWNARIRAAVSLCRYTFRAAWLEPGQSVEGFAIESARLPALGEVRVFGAAESVAWPSEDGAVPSNVYKLADSVNGRDGGWFRLTAVVPSRDRSALDSPARGLDWLTSDLELSCAAGWVSPNGVCRSLRTKLDNARRSAAGGKLQAADGQLGAFLEELAAQRGKHVQDNAYVLLTLIAEATRQLR